MIWHRDTVYADRMIEHLQKELHEARQEVRVLTERLTQTVDVLAELLRLQHHTPTHSVSPHGVLENPFPDKVQQAIDLRSLGSQPMRLELSEFARAALAHDEPEESVAQQILDGSELPDI